MKSVTNYYIKQLLKIMSNVIMDIEIFEQEKTLERVKAFLKHLLKDSTRTHFKVFIPRDYQMTKKHLKILKLFNLKENNFVVRPKSMYKRYSLIHKVFNNPNPDWLECRKTLYLNYFSSNNPIHSPKEFGVYPTLKDAKQVDGKTRPIICPLRSLRTCNIVRNCIHNCIYCYVPHSGAPKMPVVVCVNMPERVEEQLNSLKGPYIMTDFGSITDPANPVIDEVFKVFQDTFLVLKKKNYPTLVLTKAVPSKSLIESLKFKNALLAFSLYHLNPLIKKRWELNTPPPLEVLKGMRYAKKKGVRTALRIDIFPGYNDDLLMLKKIIKISKRYGNIEHVVVGSFRGGKGILKQIREQNPEGFRMLVASLDQTRYADNVFRPRKDLRVKWYAALSDTCKKEGVSFSLCKEEPDLVAKFTSEWLRNGAPKCLCNAI